PAVRPRPAVEAGGLPGFADLDLTVARPDAVTHEIRGEQIDEASGTVRGVGGILRPVPVMQRKGGIDLAQHRLEAVQQLAVPGQECRAEMHVPGVVDLVLFEPVTDAAGDRIGLGAGKEFLVQGQYRVAESVAFGLRYGCDV